MAGKLYTSYKGFPSFFSGKIASIEDVEEGTLVVAGSAARPGGSHRAAWGSVRPPRHP